MRPSLNYLSFLILSLALGCPSPQTASTSTVTKAVDRADSSPHLVKALSTPDYLQTDPAYGGLPGGGTMYCAPVSVSNSLIWLDDNGFGLLAPNSADRKRDQFRMIVLLGSAEFMNTSLSSGTDVVGVLRGVSMYITQSGYRYRRLEYQGWRPHQARFSTNIDIPELHWIRTGIQGNGSAWVNIGWYRYSASSDVYRRVGGHWLTVVGATVPKNCLVFHDPSTRARRGIHYETGCLDEIDSGEMHGNYSGLPRRAAGFYKIRGSIPLASNADTIILDGVVVLEM